MGVNLSTKKRVMNCRGIRFLLQRLGAIKNDMFFDAKHHRNVLQYIFKDFPLKANEYNPHNIQLPCVRESKQAQASDSERSIGQCTEVLSFELRAVRCILRNQSSALGKTSASGCFLPLGLK